MWRVRRRLERRRPQFTRTSGGVCADMILTREQGSMLGMSRANPARVRSVAERSSASAGDPRGTRSPDDTMSPGRRFTLLAILIAAAVLMAQPAEAKPAHPVARASTPLLAPPHGHAGMPASRPPRQRVPRPARHAHAPSLRHVNARHPAAATPPHLDWQPVKVAVRGAVLRLAGDEVPNAERSTPVCRGPPRAGPPPAPGRTLLAPAALLARFALPPARVPVPLRARPTAHATRRPMSPRPSARAPPIPRVPSHFEPGARLCRSDEESVGNAPDLTTK